LLIGGIIQLKYGKKFIPKREEQVKKSEVDAKIKE